MPLPQSQGAWKGILSRRRGFITPEGGVPPERFFTTPERFCRRRGVVPPEGGIPPEGFCHAGEAAAL